MNQPQVVIVKEQGNALGLAGLIFSILGWLTCGVLCPLGALLSFFGLFSRGPKMTAVAGLIVGFPGVIFFVVFGLGFILAFLGIGAAAIDQAEKAAKQAREAQSGMVASSEATPKTDELATDLLTVPEETQELIPEPPTPTPAQVRAAEELRLAEEQRKLKADAARELEMAAKEREKRIREEQAAERRKAIDATDYREWSSKDGKFKITGDLVRINDLTVTIKRVDNDKEVDVALDKLSDNDNEYVNKLKDE